ncbi:LuxR family quorum sensing-dependent transcriptional regulator [Roseiarcus fermentans]|uniref:LuxR family quorum sensing-dependent transcriptional regulator n=1 Tax=Roseiarcus fermentans TaxID=1473586 RepID=A0A366FML1_9HYPH|nr:LuxR family transcriptional regulator [Roseiarcus fermentans]RBP15882.1 LuxR family quorum sensing-dependent transcriptional regulator [Roseiarcus fermentans]
MPVPASSPPTAREATSFDDLRALAHRFAAGLGCDYFAYLALRPPAGAAHRGEILVSDYPPEWQARYLCRHYKYHDPVVTLAHDAREPYSWGHAGFLSAYGKGARRVFDEATEFRILEGCAVPTAGVAGDAGVFGVTLSHRGQARQMLRDRDDQIQLFAADFHAAAVRIAYGPERKARLELSPRQREVLAWTAEGLSSEATAERIGITASAVNYHLTAVCRKLGAANKVQAVALAIRRALI